MDKKNIFLFLALILNSTILHAKIGCMDNSYHTKRKGDTKTYHYVQCNCPCHKYQNSFVRGKCPKCGHYHDPKELEIVIHTKPKKIVIAEKQK